VWVNVLVNDDMVLEFPTVNIIMISVGSYVCVSEGGVSFGTLGFTVMYSYFVR